MPYKTLFTVIVRQSDAYGKRKEQLSSLLTIRHIYDGRFYFSENKLRAWWRQAQSGLALPSALQNINDGSSVRIVKSTTEVNTQRLS